MMHTHLAAIAALVLFGASAMARGQVSGGQPTFEVASVKPSPNDLAPEGISVSPGGNVRFTRFPVRTLITIAYRAEGLQRFDQLINGPAWLATDRFDIEAKVDASPDAAGTPNQLPLMLRSLLRDRFRLRAHAETRNVRAYALVRARSDGGPGPGLRESTVVCPAPNRSNQDPEAWCGIRAAAGAIRGRAATMEQLAGNLSGYPVVDRFVTNRTGLMARYDFALEYSPPPPAGDATSSTGASLFTALTEQLGLKLQSETKTVPVLVIDSIERPAPN